MASGLTKNKDVAKDSLATPTTTQSESGAAEGSQRKKEPAEPRMSRRQLKAWAYAQLRADSLEREIMALSSTFTTDPQSNSASSSASTSAHSSPPVKHKTFEEIIQDKIFEERLRERRAQFHSEQDDEDDKESHSSESLSTSEEHSDNDKDAE